MEKSLVTQRKNCYNGGRGVICMKDIPIFTTEYGAASLGLREIPYREEAYITVLDSQDSDRLLEECISFCRACGAEKVYAKGHEFLERFPLHTCVWEMRGDAVADPEKLESLFPVTEQTSSRWRSYYNEKMRSVDNASTLTAFDEKKLTESGTYFVHRDGNLLGIGWLEDTNLLAIAAEKGMGERVMHTLLSLVEGASVKLEVASTNARAIRLYEKMGFIKTAEISRWYRVL